MSPYMVKRMVGLATVIATIVLVVVFVVVMVQTVQLTKLNAEAKRLDASIERLIASKADLENGIAERNTDEYVEQQARENLGMIKDGEIVFIYG